MKPGDRTARLFFLSLLMLAVVAAGLRAEDSAPARPNVLLIMADDLGFSDLVKRSEIDSLDIPYKIEKGRFITEDLELKSANSILSFSGSGNMDFDGRLDLELEPQLPGSKIKVPILSDLIDLTGIDLEKIVSGIKRGILKVKVSGDVAAPGVDLVAASLVGVPVQPPGPVKGKDKDKDKDKKDKDESKDKEPPPGE